MVSTAISRQTRIGRMAPDFRLFDQEENEIRLSEHRGSKVLLSFHPMAWTSVCSKQMVSLEENADKFEELKTVPLGLSIDTVPSKKAWANSLRIERTPLLSDFWPHGDYSQKMDLFRPMDGTSERANVIVDEMGKIEFFKVYDISELPPIAEIIDYLEKRRK